MRKLISLLSLILITSCSTNNDNSQDQPNSSNGRLSKLEKYSNGTTLSGTTYYTYNNNGKLNQQIFDDGIYTTTVTFVYDASGKLTTCNLVKKYTTLNNQSTSETQERTFIYQNNNITEMRIKKISFFGSPSGTY